MTSKDSENCFECANGFLLNPLQDFLTNTYKYECKANSSTKLEQCRIKSFITNDCYYNCSLNDPSDFEKIECLKFCHKGCKECKKGYYQ